MGELLVVNAGSSSVKIAVFDKKLSRLISGSVEEIGPRARLKVGDVVDIHPLTDHESALAALVQHLTAAGHAPEKLVAAAHRVVHGGRTLVAPCRLTPEHEAEIERCVALAPLHNPPNLLGIRAIARLHAHLPQYACFDTAFHATNPEVALRYALPQTEDARGIRRYGFHGISYASLVDRLPGLSGRPLPRRLLALHLGNGASICAIHDGRSVATTMGYSPLDGLTMGTRAGGIDGNAVLRLAEDHGIAGAAALLNRQSGLLGLGGSSDMRALAASDTPEARFAIAHFCYWAIRHSGSLIAAMGGLDAVAFTGGIGEHDGAVRAEIMAGLGWLGLAADPAANAINATRLHADGSSVAAWIIPADEEHGIASDVMRLRAAESAV